MKYFLTAVWALVCVVVLGFGYIQWHEKTAVKAEVQEKTVLPSGKKETGRTVDDVAAIVEKAANWPDEARFALKKAIVSGKPYKIAFVGSKALDGWFDAAQKDLVSVYGPGVVEVTSHTYDVTTTDFINKRNQLEIAADKPQLIVFEPLLMNNNGKLIAIDVTLANVAKIVEEIKSANPGVTFILQPSYPLYNSKLYPQQVQALKNYAVKNKLAFIDHWSAWPDVNDVKLKDYLKPDSSSPNEKGNAVWENFVVDYLVKK